mgnify:CR=1 FL=1
METFISPFEIAENVIAIQIDDANYNNKTQMRFENLDTIIMGTYQGTCTYDYKGQPKDSDND